MLEAMLNICVSNYLLNTSTLLEYRISWGESSKVWVQPHRMPCHHGLRLVIGTIRQLGEAE